MRKALFHLKRSDPVLRGIISCVGPYRIAYAEPDFHTLAKSVVYQQLSGKAALTIFGRLLDTARAGEGRLRPETLLRIKPARLREAGLSQQKSAYLTDLAQRTVSGQLCFDRLPEMPDDEVIAHLTQVKGVGVWTAHMFLIFALRRPDVLPTGDLGVRSAIRRAYGFEELPTPREVEEVAGPWRPWCSVASWYLWRSLEGVAAL
ncbi:MAG: DNA-3-methyladenine glycosylase family protein [Bryobacteraceae bacterium]